MKQVGTAEAAKEEEFSIRCGLDDLVEVLWMWVGFVARWK